MSAFNFGSLKAKMVQPEIIGGPGGTAPPQQPGPQLPGGPGGTADPITPSNQPPMPRYDIGNSPIGYGAAPVTNYGQTDRFGWPYQPQPAPQVPNTPFAPPGGMPQRPPEYQPHTPFAPGMGASPWLSMGNMGNGMGRFF